MVVLGLRLVHLAHLLLFLALRLLFLAPRQLDRQLFGHRLRYHFQRRRLRYQFQRRRLRYQFQRRRLPLMRLQLRPRPYLHLLLRLLGALSLVRPHQVPLEASGQRYPMR